MSHGFSTSSESTRLFFFSSIADKRTLTNCCATCPDANQSSASVLTPTNHFAGFWGRWRNAPPPSCAWSRMWCSMAGGRTMAARKLPVNTNWETRRLWTCFSFTYEFMVEKCLKEYVDDLMTLSPLSVFFSLCLFRSFSLSESVSCKKIRNVF